jgi:hypothetical protein
MTDSPHLSEVVTLYDSNIRDPIATLRAIADEIEAGKYGDVGCIALCLLGDTMEVFSAGPDSAGPSAAVLLHAGFMRLTGYIEQHGK